MGIDESCGVGEGPHWCGELRQFASAGRPLGPLAPTSSIVVRPAQPAGRRPGRRPARRGPGPVDRVLPQSRLHDRLRRLRRLRRPGAEREALRPRAGRADPHAGPGRRLADQRGAWPGSCSRSGSAWSRSCEPLPIGASLDDTDADAVLLIGDRAMRPADGRVRVRLGPGRASGREWTGLPFVFAMWIARPGVDLARARPSCWPRPATRVSRRLDEIARHEAPRVGIPEADCLAYLRDHLQFPPGPRGSGRACELFDRAGRADTGWPRRESKLVFDDRTTLLDKAVAGERLTPDEGLAAAGVARSGRAGPGGRRGHAAAAPRAVSHLQHRPQHQLHEHLHERLPLLRVLAPAGRPGRLRHRPRRTVSARSRRRSSWAATRSCCRAACTRSLKLDWYEELLRDIKQRFPADQHPRLQPAGDRPLRRDLQAAGRRRCSSGCKAAGLGSLPGGGAEILSTGCGSRSARCKVSADGWLDVCRVWHELGGRGSATMMFGHVETLAERIEHLERLRRLQDETGGFTAFICWTFQPGHTELADLPQGGRRSSTSRRWPSAGCISTTSPTSRRAGSRRGSKIGQMALRFGANDMGSLMIEENVVAAAGTSFRTSEAEIRRAIAEAGYDPATAECVLRARATSHPTSRAVDGTSAKR